MQLQSKTRTIIKERPYQSNNPNAGGMRDIPKGQVLDVRDVAPGLFNGHREVLLSSRESWGDRAYLYHEHFDFPEEKKRSPVGMRTSQAGIDLIKDFEGCELEAYRCSAGVLTIGYGSTHNVRPGMCITRDRAESLLREDLVQYEEAVQRLVTVPLTQNQFDALVCWVYNVGPGAMQSSTLLRKLNNGKPDKEVANELLRWDKAGGRSLPGLTRRRKSERKLFLS